MTNAERPSSGFLFRLWTLDRQTLRDVLTWKQTPHLERGLAAILLLIWNLNPKVLLPTGSSPTVFNMAADPSGSNTRAVTATQLQNVHTADTTIASSEIRSRLLIKKPGVRNEIVAFVSEFCGTFMFLFMAFTALQTSQNRGAVEPINQESKPGISSLMYIATAFGLSLLVNCWLFYRISGGMFNPAVALGLFLVGAITPVRLAVVFPAQLIGSIAASWALAGLLPGELEVGTELAPGVSTVQGLFIEMFLTTQLMITILLLAVEKHKATHIAPIGIGLSLFIGHLAGVYFTGASLNPCRSFGPATVSGFQSTQWIYWLGPCMGSILAVGVWKLLRHLEYQTTNPGQDFDDLESAAFKPPRWPTVVEVRRPIVHRSHTGNSIAKPDVESSH
ncbi:aquaporin-like protein [Zalerion maritima]|uniref:Aquaporin-like protein n=1 Tax=Zalerion maritima TaxID=339359 RepID=A0AAD5S0P1_9PEZI|nr:aquaporin-like protein [Zalerion maritima]